jgi:ATP-dependent helicase/nuclease subunit A
MSSPSQVSQRPIDESFLIEASAGTGKTRTLVDRMVQAVRSGARIEGMVAVTFTHAAAGEMKVRLRQELEAARRQASDPSEQARLHEGLQHLERAFIGTIHAFCAEMLRQRPVEACVDPAFSQMAEPESSALFDGVFRKWLRERLQSNSPALIRAMTHLAHGGEEESLDPANDLRWAAWKLAEWRDFDAPWSRQAFHRAQELEVFVPRLREFVELWSQCSDPAWEPLYRDLRPVSDLLQSWMTARAASVEDLDSIEAGLLRLPKDCRWAKGGRGQYGPGISRDAMFQAWESLCAAITTFGGRAGADLMADLRDELWPAVRRYEETKRKAGKLDFQDLLMRAAALLQNQDARTYFQARYRHLFVDEFQDTDPLQAEILLLLSADNPQESDWRKSRPLAGKLFVVGDPKQSIYRFRRADVPAYQRILQGLESRGVQRDALTVSRRSVASLQRFVNAAFSDIMEGYLPLEGGREDIPDQPAIVALPVPKPYGTREITQKAIDQCTPSTVAAFIDWLVRDSGWKVRNRETNVLAPVQEKDICILFRRFSQYGSDITQDYVRALEARSLRHVLVGSKSFHKREEIATLRAALRAIEWPDDELNVFATLKGPLFAISDGSLLRFRLEGEKRRLHPLRIPLLDPDPDFDPIVQALECLADLHKVRNRIPIADVLVQLLDRTRAHAGFAFRKSGKRVLANVHRLLDDARRFEASGATSFRSFVQYLDQEAELSEASETALTEEANEGVKIMNVHKSKGLEFPVVILADITAKLSREDSGRYLNPDSRLCAQSLLMGLKPWELLDPEIAALEEKWEREEGERVAYVAATRARDLLIVCGVGDSWIPRVPGWLSPLDDALYPPADERRSKRPAPGCPEFGPVSVLERPQGWQGVENSIRPGLHHPTKGEHSVVWFDPKLLTLEAGGAADLDQMSALQQGRGDEGLARYRDWSRERARRIDAGSKPAFQVERVTTLPSTRQPPPIAVEIVRFHHRPQDRPSGRTFGKIVHALLERAPLAGDLQQLANLAKARGLLLGASQIEVDAAVATVQTALQHPLLRQAASADRVQREWPVLFRDAQGLLLEGTIDLAFHTSQGWTVVDFKTGPASAQKNERQVALYAEALQKATGEPVRAVLLEL